MTRKRITIEQVREVVRLFPNHTKKEIREKTGVGLSSIDRIQARYKLRKSPEHLSAIGQRAGKASSMARGGTFIGSKSPEAIAKRSATYKKLVQTEKARAAVGLPRKTKIRLPHGPKAYHDQIWYLRKNGYIIDEVQKIAYYTPGTHRARNLERCERGKRKGCMYSYFDFKPYNDEQNENKL